MELQPLLFLPVDIDIEKGGRAVKMRMDREGRTVTAKEGNFKRVYADDGKSYTEDDRSEDVAEAARKKENIQQLNTNIVNKDDTSSKFSKPSKTTTPEEHLPGHTIGKPYCIQPAELEEESSTRLPSPSSYHILTVKPNLRTPIISKLTPPPPLTRRNYLLS